MLSLIVVVQSLICIWLFPIPWTAASQSSLSFIISQSLLKLISMKSVMLSNHLILCHSPCPLAFNLSKHQSLFQWVSSSHQVAKVLELQRKSFQWIFRIDFLYHWLVWSLCSLRDSQESSPAHNSKISILWHSPFVMVQHPYPYMTIGKIIALTIQTLVSKVMSLLFNTLSKFVILTVKGFSVVIEADVLLELSFFLYDPMDVGNLSSGSSDFLNPAWTSGSSQFSYCWSLACRILSITLLACEMSEIVW